MLDAPPLPEKMGGSEALEVLAAAGIVEWGVELGEVDF